MNVWMEGCKSVSHRMSRNWLSFWTRNVSVCKQHPSQQEFLSCHVLSLSPWSSKQGCCYEFPPLAQQNIRLTAMLFNLPKQLTLQRVITIFQSFLYSTSYAVITFIKVLRFEITLFFFHFNLSPLPVIELSHGIIPPTTGRQEPWFYIE